MSAEVPHRYLTSYEVTERERLHGSRQSRSMTRALPRQSFERPGGALRGLCGRSSTIDPPANCRAGDDRLDNVRTQMYAAVLRDPGVREWVRCATRRRSVVERLPNGPFRTHATRQFGDGSEQSPSLDVASGHCYVESADRSFVRRQRIAARTFCFDGRHCLNTNPAQEVDAGMPLSYFRTPRTLSSANGGG